MQECECSTTVHLSLRCFSTEWAAVNLILRQARTVAADHSVSWNQETEECGVKTFALHCAERAWRSNDVGRPALAALTRRLPAAAPLLASAALGNCLRPAVTGQKSKRPSKPNMSRLPIIHGGSLGSGFSILRKTGLLTGKGVRSANLPKMSPGVRRCYKL